MTIVTRFNNPIARTAADNHTNVMWPDHDRPDLSHDGMTPMRPVTSEIVLRTTTLPLPHLPAAPSGWTPVVVAGYMVAIVVPVMMMFVMVFS